MNQFEHDIPEELARTAFSGVSWDPEGRGSRYRTGYAEDLTNDYAALAALAARYGTQATLDEEFTRYREGYRKRTLAFLHSESRCISSFITGPSNFPVARAEKRNNISHKRLNELCDFRARGLAAIRRKLSPPRCIRTEDADAIEKLEARIEAAKTLQAQMKEANSIIRKSAKHGHEAQVAALVSLGFTDSQAATLLKPDFCGRIGFADYQLTNNNANIKRMEGRVIEIGRLRDTQAEEAEGENARLELAPDDNRVRLFFPGIPPTETREELKRNGFRWTPSLGCWQAYMKPWSVQTAKRIAGVPS